MKKAKKFLSVILSLVMTITCLPLVGVELYTTANAMYYSPQVGDIYQYGYYPQTDVTEEMGSILDGLNSEWLSYGYYAGTGSIGTMTPHDYMYYTDIEYQGDWYRGVTFNLYRPANTAASWSETSGPQKINGYEIGYTYWFLYEPLTWYVINEEGLAVCDRIIDSQAFNNYVGSGYVNEAGNYASNFVESSIFRWLNDYEYLYNDYEACDFYTTASSNELLDKFAQETVWTYTDSDGNTCEPYGYAGLLSADEYETLASEYPDILTEIEAVKLWDENGDEQYATDYALCQGFNNSSRWWLRSQNTFRVQVVSTSTSTVSQSLPHSTNIGVRPAIKIHSCEENDYSGNIITEPTCTEPGIAAYGCSVCGEGYHEEEIATIPHDLQVISEVAPSCTEEGYTEYVCLSCGVSHREYIPVQGHVVNTDDYTEYFHSEPTCTTSGVYEKMYRCEMCGLEIASEWYDIPALGHSYEAVVTAPTCTEQGYTTYTCTVCGDSYISDYVEPHEYVDGTCKGCKKNKPINKPLPSQIRFDRNPDDSYKGHFDVRTRAKITDEDFKSLVGSTNGIAINNILKVGFVYSINGENFSIEDAQTVAKGGTVSGYVDAPVSYIQDADGYYMFTCLVTDVPDLDREYVLYAYPYICVNDKWYFADEPICADFDSLYTTYYPVASEKYGW